MGDVSQGEVVDVKTMVTLRAANGDQWEVEAGAASWYKGGYAIDVPSIQYKAIFDMIIEYINHHKNYDDLGKSFDLDIALWDHYFLADLDNDTLYYLLMAARLLQQDGLLKLIYKRVADMIKGRSIEEIRTIFNIRTGLTLEQEKLIQLRNQQMLKPPENPAAAGRHQGH